LKKRKEKERKKKRKRLCGDLCRHKNKFTTRVPPINKSTSSPLTCALALRIAHSSPPRRITDEQSAAASTSSDFDPFCMHEEKKKRNKEGNTFKKLENINSVTCTRSCF
jgi:hypothetical protein